MFNAKASKADFLAKVANLEPFIMGLRAGPEELEGRAEYIRQFAKAAADHIEELMADASSSISCGRIDEEDARAIADAGDDCAGQLMRAADLVAEAA
jgi:hypothetical protein